MKTFYKKSDNSLEISVMSDSGRILHAFCYILYKRDICLVPVVIRFENIDLTQPKFSCFIRSITNMPFSSLFSKCLYEDCSLDPELDFELR